MKKLLALLLAMAMLFCLTACSFVPSTDDCKDGHVDSDGDEKCDVCKKDMPNDDGDDGGDGNDGNGGDGDDSYLAPTISEAIAAQLEAAKSMKIDFSFSFESVYDGYTDYEDENGDTVIEKEDDIDKIDVAFSIVLSKTELGLNAKITLTETEYEDDEDGNLTPDVMTDTIYLIDGSLYNFDDDLEAYVETMIPSLDGIMSGASVSTIIVEMASALFEELEISEEDREALIAEIGKAITAIFEIIDKKGDFNLDFKPYLDDLFAYVEKIDVETMTLEALIDDALALVDEELTIAALLDKVKSLASLTVAEALTELDAWLTENYETTLQGIYDEIVADEKVEQLVRMYLEMMGTESGEPIADGDVKAFLDELKAVKIDEFIAAYVNPDMVLYDLIMTFVSSMGGSTEPAPEPNPNNPGDSYDDDGGMGGIVFVSDGLMDEEPSYPPINTLFGVIADCLDLTLAEVEEDMGTPFFTSIKEACAAIKINALNTSSSISFTDGFALSELALSAKLDIDAEYAYGLDETKTEKLSFNFDYSFKISDISDSAVEITLPASAKVVFGIFNIEQYFTNDEGYSLQLYYFSSKEEEGEFVLDGVLNSMRYYLTMKMPTERQDTYVFDYVNYSDYTTGKLSITFDYESFTYEVEFLS